MPFKPHNHCMWSVVGIVDGPRGQRATAHVAPASAGSIGIISAVSGEGPRAGRVGLWIAGMEPRGALLGTQPPR